MNILQKILTFLKTKREIKPTREVITPLSREVSTPKPIIDSLACPYCNSTDFQRRGFRQKKMEKVQLYLCNSCGKTFTPHLIREKHYPLSVVLDALSIYNLGYNLEQTCKLINQREFQAGTNVKKPADNLGIGASTLSTWITEFANLCRFLRMRDFALKKYQPKDMVITATLAHRQLYRFRFHRAKCKLLIEEEFKHRRFGPLYEFLEMVPAECPHQYYQDGLRASEAPLTFSKKQMIVRAKQNYATKTCEFVLQSVKERKDRHEALERFMLFNDSVTVATEVPVYITRDDLEHFQTQLGFELIGEMPKLITGHIDILQIRNGQIHIMDYKPNAQKERPIEQLTLYAMALSRLTGLRLFEFKCAWFDEKDYFEFYPLHVLHKPKKGARRRKISTIEGTYEVNKDEQKIEKVRPI